MVLHELSRPLTTLHGILEAELRQQEHKGRPRVAVQQALEQADQAIRVIRAWRDLVAIETEPSESSFSEPFEPHHFQETELAVGLPGAG